MTAQQKLRRERLKAGSFAAALTALFTALATTFPQWWPALIELLPDFSGNEPAPEVDDSPNSPVQKDCNQNVNGNNNTISGSGPCSKTYNNNQSRNTHIRVGDWNFSSHISTEIDQSSTKILESIHLSHSYAAINSWIVSKALMTVMPVMEVSQQNTTFIQSMVLSKETNVSEKVFTKQLAAGIRNGSLAPKLVAIFGYDPEKLAPELIVSFVPEDLDKPQINREESATLSPSDHQSSKFPHCWNASVPSNGSNFCNPGDHLF